jgi:hypothetical protein
MNDEFFGDDEETNGKPAELFMRNLGKRPWGSFREYGLHYVHSGIEHFEFERSVWWMKSILTMASLCMPSANRRSIYFRVAY